MLLDTYVHFWTKFWRIFVTNFTIPILISTVFEKTTEYEPNSTIWPTRSKYECDTSDESTNLQIFVSVCKCLTLKNSEIRFVEIVSHAFAFAITARTENFVLLLNILKAMWSFEFVTQKFWIRIMNVRRKKMDTVGYSKYL